MHNLQYLNKKEWVMDYGFRKALAADLGTITFAGQVVSRGRQDIVAYWQNGKCDYALWELLFEVV